jgi:basic amino acid/polyamine antiporter, APA family
MSTATRAGLLARKPTATLIAEAGDQRGLQRAVGALDLTALGIGGIIGTGIFVIIGEAIGTPDLRSSSASSLPRSPASSRP